MQGRTGEGEGEERWQVGCRVGTGALLTPVPSHYTCGKGAGGGWVGGEKGVRVWARQVSHESNNYRWIRKRSATVIRVRVRRWERGRVRENNTFVQVFTGGLLTCTRGGERLIRSSLRTGKSNLHSHTHSPGNFYAPFVLFCLFYLSFFSFFYIFPLQAGGWYFSRLFLLFSLQELFFFLF